MVCDHPFPDQTKSYLISYSHWLYDVQLYLSLGGGFWMRSMTVIMTSCGKSVTVYSYLVFDCVIPFSAWIKHASGQFVKNCGNFTEAADISKLVVVILGVWEDWSFEASALSRPES